MQAGPPPEDIHAILNRFNTWSGKGATNGNGHAKGAPEEGIREIPYEEAIRQHRSRQTARNPQRAAAPGTKATPAPQPATKAAPPPPVPEAQEDLPLWAANLPVIPDNEPVIELKASPAPELTSGRSASAPAVAAAHSAARLQRTARPVARPAVKRQSLAAKTPEREPLKETLLSAFPGLSDRAFVDIPPAPIPRRSPPQRTAAPLPLTRKMPAVPAQASPAPASVTSTPPAKPTPPVNRAKALSPALPAKAQAKPVAQTAPVAAPIKTAPPPSAPRPVVKRAATAAAPRPAVKRAAPVAARKLKSRTRKRAPFRQVLASTVQQPKASLAPSKAAPDRTRRITTRFSPGEERRIGKCAAELGITVSAYLRRCALSAAAQKAMPEAPAPPPAGKMRKQPARATEHSMEYSTPAPSLFGGWLALLRNRFLGPPVRFSEDA